MADFTPADVERWMGVLENPDASPRLRSMAEHLITIYLQYGGSEGEGARIAGDELLRIESRHDLDAFSEYVFGLPPYVHQREITKVLMNENRKRVLIVVPPGHGKSTYVSLIYPGWWMGRNPDKSAIMVASGSRQVEKFVGQIRPLIEKNERYKAVFPEATPDDVTGWLKDTLYLANRTRPIPYPNLFAAGMTSSNILGSRADLLILDDVTTQQQSRSEGELDNQREFLKQTLMTRLKPDGRCIVIMTRWHANDLAPTFINDLNFEVVHMPALGEDDQGAYVDYVPTRAYLKHPKKGDKAKTAQWLLHETPDQHVKDQLISLYREAIAEGFEAEITKSVACEDRPCVRKYLHKDHDRAIWPEEFSREAHEQKRNEGPVQFRLVYQGNPTGVTGDVFKRQWFRTYGGEGDPFQRVPKDVAIFMSVDVSVGNSKKGKGDWFVILVIAVDRYGNKFIIDHYRDKILPPFQRKEIQRMYLDEHPETVAILIETTNYQAALFHELAAVNVPVMEYKPIRQKELRIESSSVFYQQGKVFLPHSAPWKDDFIDEHTQYPRGRHDDQIDAGAQILEFLSGYRQEPEEFQIGFG